jgi:hypothetical protein
MGLATFRTTHLVTLVAILFTFAEYVHGVKI